jgi:hypothetical protein
VTESAFTFDETTHTFRLGSTVLLSITQILKERGLINTDYFTPEGRDRGKAVHDACWFLDDGDLDWKSVDPRILPRVKAYERFKKDVDFKPDIIEKRLYDPVNLFAGIPDRVGMLAGRRSVVELKTGVISAWVKLQTAAQNILVDPRVYFPRFALQLKEDGTYTLHEFKDHIQDRQMFLAELSCLKWRKHNGYGD